MTRRLVLTNDAARHPLRRALPPATLAALPENAQRDQDSDWKLFVLSFLAFFTCFYTMIA